MAKLITGALTGALVVAFLGGCSQQHPPTPVTQATAAESADEFAARVNKELGALALEVAAAGFTQDTFITVDTQLLNARANDRYLAYLSHALEESKRYDGQRLSPATARARSVLPVPGGPTSKTPRGTFPPRRWRLMGSRKKSTISPRSCLAALRPATSSNFTSTALSRSKR